MTSTKYETLSVYSIVHSFSLCLAPNYLFMFINTQVPSKWGVVPSHGSVFHPTPLSSQHSVYLAVPLAVLYSPCQALVFAVVCGLHHARRYSLLT